MKTPNSSKVAAGEKRGASEVITPKLDSLYNDADMSGVMTRSRSKQLCDSSTGKLYETSKSSANMRRALLRCFEDSPGTVSQESTCPSNKKSQKNTLLEAGSVTPSDNDSVIHETQTLRIERSLKSDNDEEDCNNAHKSVSVALYNASETESPFVTVTVSGLSNNIKAAIMVHDIKKGSKEVYETDFKVNSSLLATNGDEQSPKQSKTERKAVKYKKKSRSSFSIDERTVTAVSEHIAECGNESVVIKFPQKSDEVPRRSTELINGPSVSSTNDELSPYNSQKERQIKKSRKGKSPPPNKNVSAVPTTQEHITELENEMCTVKSAQKFNRHKNMWNPTVHILQLAAEFEERMKSGSIRCWETPLKKSTDLESDTNSEVNTPLSGLGPLDHPLIPSNKGEPSPDYSATERKAKKSRKANSSLLKGNEGTVTTVSEHITAFENEINVVKFQGSDKCSLKSTGPQDGPSLTSDGDKSSPNNSHKESKLKNSRKSKSLPQNKNEWNISTVPEGTTELGKEMSEVKTPQKFDKCKNRGNPIMTVSQLPVEIEECPKSVVVVRERETQLENLSDAEYALADKACSVNNTSDSDSETRQVESNHNAKSSPLLKSKKTKEVRSESSESDSDAESRKAIMESAQRRIIQNISTSESDSKKYVRPRTMSTGSDTSSDSVPEAISFSAGQQLVMESWQNAADSVQREKHRRKEKRKERLEKYKQQKEEKLIRLKEKRASQEDASCSSSEESGYEEVDVPSVLEKSNRKAGVKWKKENLDDLSQSKGKRFHSDDEGEPKGMKAKKRKSEQKDPSQLCGNLRKLPDDVLENLPDQVPMKLQKTDSAATSKGKRSHEKHAADKKQEYKNQRDIDYIPLSTCGATEFGVMPLDKFMRAPKSMAERAAEFRQNMLFGTHIRRGPANAQTIYQHKLKASGKGRFLR